MLRRGRWLSPHGGQVVSHVREGPQAHVDGSAGRYRLGWELLDRLKHGPLTRCGQQVHGPARGHVVRPGPGLVEAGRGSKPGVFGDGELKFVGGWLIQRLYLRKKGTNYDRYGYVSRTNLDARS